MNLWARSLLLGALLCLLGVSPHGAYAEQVFVTNSLDSSEGAASVGRYDALSGAPLNAAFISDQPAGVALALHANTLYFAGAPRGVQSVLAFDATTGVALAGFVPIQAAEPANDFRGLAVNGDGTVLFAIQGTLNRVSTYNAATGAPLAPDFITGLGDPRSLAYANGHLYVAAIHNGIGVINAYDAATGAPLVNWSVPLLTQPDSLAVRGNQLFVSNRNTGDIALYHAMTGASISPNFAPGRNHRVQLATFGSRLYIAHTAENFVGAYNADTGAPIKADLITGLNGPFGLAVGPTAPTVTLPTRTAVSGTQATLGGSVAADGGDALIERGVVLSETSLNADPLLDGPSVSQYVASGTASGTFAIPIGSLTPGQSYTFRAYAKNGVYTGYSSAKSFLAAVSPEIGVAGKGINGQFIGIMNGKSMATWADGTEFGEATAGTGIVTGTFTIKNSGTGALNLTGNPVVALSNAVDFTVMSQPAISLAAGGSSTTFTISFNPATGGVKSTTVTILSDDAYENPFTFTLHGEAITPPVVTQPTSAKIQATSARLGGTVTDRGGTYVTKAGVVFAPTDIASTPAVGDGHSTVASVAVSALITDSFTVDVTGLAPGTSYSFRAFAQNNASGNVYSYSDVGSFTTPALPPTVTTPTAAAITASGATLGGNVTAANGAQITERGILYSTDSFFGANDYGVVTATGTTGAFTVPVSGLQPDTQYYFMAYAINSGGTGATAMGLQQPATFTTLPKPLVVASPSLNYPTIKDVTYEGATLGAKVTSAGSAPVTTRGVLVSKTSENSDPQIGGANVQTNFIVAFPPGEVLGEFTIPVRGLAEETQYSWRAFAENSGGPAYTSVGTFTTLKNTVFKGIDDLAITTRGETRIYPLANDVAPGRLPLQLVSVSDPAIAIDHRALIIPAGFAGTFTYTFTDGALTGQASVTVTRGTPAAVPRVFSGLLYETRSTGGLLLAEQPLAGAAEVTFAPNGRTATAVVKVGASLVRKIVAFPAGRNTGAVTTVLGVVTVTRNADGTVGCELNLRGETRTGVLQARHAAGSARRYHVALSSIDQTLAYPPGPTSPPPVIPGGGYAIVTVSAAGSVLVSGVLPDGSVLSTAATLRENDTIVLYTPVRTVVNPAAMIAGELLVADLASTDLTGELGWVKPKQRAGLRGLHLEGVSTTLTANGSIYRGQIPLAGAGMLCLSGGGLVAETDSVTITAGRPAAVGALKAWAAYPTTGVFLASVKLPGIARPFLGRGLYLPKSKTAWDYFPGPFIGGRIELSVP